VSYSLIERKIVATDTTSVVFSGLSLLQGEKYILEVDLLSGAAGAATYELYANGDVTDANYELSHINKQHSASASAASEGVVSAPRVLSINSAAGRGSSRVTVSINNSRVFYNFEEFQNVGDATAANRYWLAGQVTKSSAVTALTTLQLSTVTANGIGAGSTVLLYKQSRETGGGNGNFNLQDKPSGLLWSYTSATTVTMTPSGTDGTARIPTTSGSLRDMSVETIVSSKTVDLTVSGAGGLAAEYTEAANKGYDIYFIAGASGKEFIAVESGQLPVTNWALPSGYNRYSKPVFWVHNDGSSNIMDFTQVVDSWCELEASTALLAAGASTTYAALTGANIIPTFAGAMVDLRVYGANTGANSSFMVSRTTTNAAPAAWDITIGSAAGTVKTGRCKIPTAATLYYKWLFAITGAGGYLDLKAFKPY